VPQLEKLVAVIRSREISLCLFLQAQSQLKALYKDHAETILGNCDSVIFLGGREHSTIKELSEVLGKASINMYTESRTRGQQESYGQNLQSLGRELMTIDDLVLLYQLLHRSYKKQRKYSVFWLLGTAVKMGFSITSKKAKTYTGTFCPNL